MLTAFAMATAMTFSIPAGKLVDTMSIFAAQSEVQVLYKFDGTNTVRTQAVNGVMPPREALATMLIGSGVFSEFVRPQIVALKRYWSAEAIQGDAAEREEAESQEEWTPPLVVIVRAGTAKTGERTLPPRAPIPGCVRLRWVSGMVLNRLGLLAFDMDLMLDADESDPLYCHREESVPDERPE